ncbi:MAG: hypothetical protein LBL58_17115 [Tannerellaceae bacterium]|jgi:hypothetical protein|nr:hypothetical protein [Tannerellaceae bacterium]
MKNKNIKRRIDRVLSKSVLKQACLWVILVSIIFAILFLVKWICHIEVSHANWILHFLNPANSFPETTQNIEKFWALLIGGIGMFCLSGLLIPIVSNIINRRVEKVQNGQTYYRFENHVVIIGYNKLCAGLIQQYEGTDIVLQTVREVPKIRHELFSKVKDEENITILSGNRTFEEDLKKLHLTQCKEIFILGETDEEDNDSLNIICLKKINRLLADSKKTVRCNVLFQHQSTFAIFQQQDIEIDKHIDFVPFNCHETWAQKVLVERKYKDIEYTPLDHHPITAGSDKHVHFVIIGMSGMGVAMGIQAAHLCHFPNFITRKIKTRITFIDEHADREMNFLLGRYKHLFKETDYYYRELGDERNNLGNQSSKIKFTDIEFEFIKSRIENPKMQEELAKWSLDNQSYLTIAVCFSFSPDAIAAGLYLPDEVYDRKIPVVIQQELSDYTLSMLSKRTQNSYWKYENVKPFGMLDDCYDLELADEHAAMMIKYIYNKTRTDCEVTELPIHEIEAMWKQWDETKNVIALKYSNRYCANSRHIKQRSLNIQPNESLLPEQINLLAQVEHNRWNIEKLLMGYRPTTPEEAEEIATRRRSKSFYKERFIHNDIQAYQTLTKDDEGILVNLYDVNIAKALPLMLRELDKLKTKI